MSRSPNTYPRSFRQRALAGVTILALAATGCSVGSGRRQASKAPIHPSGGASTTAPESEAMYQDELTQAGLETFQANAKKGQMLVAEGWCVASADPADSHAAIVTANPGVAEAAAGKRSVIVLVLSQVVKGQAQDGSPAPGLLFSAGPYAYRAGNGQLKDTVQDTLRLVRPGSEDNFSGVVVPISSELSKGPSGQWSYTDIRTGEPVDVSMPATIDLQGQPDEVAAQVEAICEQLNPIPGLATQVA